MISDYFAFQRMLLDAIQRDADILQCAFGILLLLALVVMITLLFYLVEIHREVATRLRKIQHPLEGQPESFAGIDLSRYTPTQIIDHAHQSTFPADGKTPQ